MEVEVDGGGRGRGGGSQIEAKNAWSAAFAWWLPPQKVIDSPMNTYLPRCSKMLLEVEGGCRERLYSNEGERGSTPHDTGR